MCAIYTIGHSNVPTGRIIDLLRQYDVTSVVDARSMPYSRHNPQFNREMLCRRLEEAGITYAYAGDVLGGRPDDPACYEDGQLSHRLVAGRPWFKRGLARLIEMAGVRRTAVMCAEEDPARCHRHHLIAQALLEKGVTVWHIRASGRREKAHPISPQAEQLALL